VEDSRLLIVIIIGRAFEKSFLSDANEIATIERSIMCLFWKSQFQSNQISGTIPTEVSLLTKLQYL
jgi:hypothetical protein